MNWNSIYGIGRGDAQVWQGNKGLEMLERQQLAEQKRRQAEEAELTADLSKLNYNEARDKDVPIFTEKLKDIKGMFTRIRGARNNEERIKLTADYNDRKNEFLHSLRVSKEAKAQIAEAKKLRLSRADDLNDDYVPNLKTLDETSTFDPKFGEYSERLMANPFRNKFDVIKFNKDIAPLVVDEVKGGLESRRVGNATVYSEKVGQQANPVKLKNLVVAQLSANNKELTRYIRERYKDMPLPQAIDAFVAEQADGINSINKVTDKTIRTQEDENWKEKLNYAEGLRRGRPGSDKENESTYRQQVIKGIVNNDKASVSEMQAYLPAGSQVQYMTSVKSPTSKGGYNLVRVTIPDYRDSKGERRRGFTEDISLSKGDAMNRLNAILNEYTGEKISPSKVNIEGGKPRGQQVEIKGKPKTANPKSGLPTINSADAYNALPKGAKYLAPDGSMRVKK